MNDMKRLLLLLGLSSYLAVSSAHAILITDTFVFSSGFDNGTVIPDGDPTGLADMRTIATPITSIDSLIVGLQISGTWNGDLYATLQHESGYVVLLNRVGRTAQTGLSAWGYADDGLDVIFDDTGGNPDIHGLTSGGGLVSGTFGTDGRETDPDMVLGTDARTTSLLNFNGLNPDGEWALFVMDNMSGDTHELQSWSLTITGDDGSSGTPVPEGGASALLLTFALAGLVGLKRTRRSS